jgi:hypothetical protein
MSGARRWALELAGSVAILAAVLAGTAGGLALLDGVPAWVNGESRDVRIARSLEEAERRVRARLVLPAYFPDTLAWPPERIRVLPGAPPAVALVFTARGGGEPRFVLSQSLGADEPSERLVPAATPLDESRIAVGTAPGTLRRIIGPDGQPWRELRWTQDGRRLVARSKGSLEELIRMARSAREQP